MQQKRLTSAYLLDIRDAIVFFLVDELEVPATDVADIMGLNKSTVSRILKGGKPSGRLIKSISKSIFNM